MKVFALAILLVSVCCLEGAVVKRQAEEEQGQDPTQRPGFEHAIQQFGQTMHQYFPPDILAEKKFAELGAQAQEQFQKFQEHMSSVTEQLTEGFNQFFSMLAEFPKKLTK